jgi:hypothetical protein
MFIQRRSISAVYSGHSVPSLYILMNMSALQRVNRYKNFLNPRMQQEVLQDMDEDGLYNLQLTVLRLLTTNPWGTHACKILFKTRIS